MPPGDDDHPAGAPEYRDKIMHATFKSPSFTFMASDGRPGKEYAEGPISLSIGMQDAAQAQRVFDGLGQGGNVEMPMEGVFWGSRFGMLTDKFGIDWMVSAPLEKP